MIINQRSVLHTQSLYKYGGTYFDLDVISLRNISQLGTNFAGAEHDFSVANAVINVDRKTETGIKFAESCIE